MVPRSSKEYQLEDGKLTVKLEPYSLECNQNQAAVMLRQETKGVNVLGSEKKKAAVEDYLKDSGADGFNILWVVLDQV